MVDLNHGDTAGIIAEAKARGILRNQLAYILATAKWETNHTLRPVEEAYWMSDDWRRKNLRYYPWHGRGYVQLTWEENYKRAQRELELGHLLTEDPDAAMHPNIAKKILITGMMEGWFTGRKLGDYVTLTASDFENARRVVNGTDKAAKIAAIAREYDRALKAVGYGEKPAKEPASDGFISAILTLITALFGSKK